MVGSHWGGSPLNILLLMPLDRFPISMGFVFFLLLEKRWVRVGSHWDGSPGRKVIVRQACNQLSWSWRMRMRTFICPVLTHEHDWGRDHDHDHIID